MFGWYSEVMDSSRNPLRNLAPAQRFQVMALLSVMWSTIFSAVAGAWFWYGELIVGHLLLVLGVLVTGYIFRTASRVKTYRSFPLRDGTARYDDVWGG